MRKYSAAGSMFGRWLGIIGGASLLTSIYMGSIMPLIIGVVALFCALNFLNGIGDREQQAQTENA